MIYEVGNVDDKFDDSGRVTGVILDYSNNFNTELEVVDGNSERNSMNIWNICDLRVTDKDGEEYIFLEEGYYDILSNLDIIMMD